MAEELTRGNSRLNLVVAFNYDRGRRFARAAQRLAAKVLDGKRGSRHRSTPTRSGSISMRPISRSRPDHPHQRRAAAV